MDGNLAELKRTVVEGRERDVISSDDFRKLKRVEILTKQTGMIKIIQWGNKYPVLIFATNL